MTIDFFNPKLRIAQNHISIIDLEFELILETFTLKLVHQTQ